MNLFHYHMIRKQHPASLRRRINYLLKLHLYLPRNRFYRKFPIAHQNHHSTEACYKRKRNNANKNWATLVLCVHYRIDQFTSPSPPKKINNTVFVTSVHPRPIMEIRNMLRQKCGVNLIQKSRKKSLVI